MLKLRNDVWDISDDEIKSIKSKEVLLKEFEHINKIIEEKEKLVNNFTLIVISGLGFIGWNIVQGLGSVFSFFRINNNDETIEYIKNNLPPLFDISLSVLFVLVFFFIIVGISVLYNSNKIIKRKNLILSQLHKKEDYIKKYKYNKSFS